jgi:hypothetical protein
MGGGGGHPPNANSMRGRAFYPAVKQAGRDNEPSSIHKTEDENRWPYTSNSHMLLRRGV